MTEREHKDLLKLPPGYYVFSDHRGHVCLAALAGVTLSPKRMDHLEMRGYLYSPDNVYFDLPDAPRFLADDSFPQEISWEKYNMLLHLHYPNEEIKPVPCIPLARPLE